TSSMLGTHPFASATALRRSQTLPPSEMKSLYGCGSPWPVVAETCVEATVRFAAELGYEVTMVKDATASYSDRGMQAALEVNLPNYASAIVTTREIVGAISSL